ncbi:MAG TPA: hypothetical protein VFS32_03040 [Candidatus Limnocylindrales bacterium]|nr:hypothetical protein [Candidatus Limnocylindrales bacterium]
MARAKRTARAEARRRYRTEAAAREADAADGEEIAPDARARKQPATATARPAARPSFLDGFRTSLQPANVRADVVTAPAVLRSSRLLWIPFALEIAAGLIALVPGLVKDQELVAVAFSSLVAQPFIAPLLAGLLAPRGAWLFGLLSGLLGGILYAIFLFSPAFDAVATRQLTVGDKSQEILLNVVVGSVYGLLLGAFAGFYRRFLRATTPARSQPRNRRPAPRRR